MTYEALVSMDSRARLACSEVFFDRLLHDLKQPLNVIRFIAQDVRMDINKERLEVDQLPESMHEIIQSIDKLILCLDRLRIFSRNKLPPEQNVHADPNQACRTALDRLRVAHPEIQISESLMSDPPAVAMDPFYLQQAIFELLINGTQAATEQTSQNPEILFSTSSLDEQLIICVRDNGPGIVEENQTRIFEPFFTTKPDAAGLGLSLSRALLSSCDGQLTLVTSNPEGSLFEVVLPYQKK